MIWITLLLILPILLCRTRIQPAVTLLILIAWWTFSLKTLGPRPHGAALAVAGTLLFCLISGIKVRWVRALNRSADSLIPSSQSAKSEQNSRSGK